MWLARARCREVVKSSILMGRGSSVEGGQLGLTAHRFVIGLGLGSKPPQAE
jgi:hypothetical protein